MGEQDRVSNDTKAVPRGSPQRMTPLWVIASFLTLTEAVLGVAATQTSGGVQIALTTFVIGFPIMVALAFFVILWFKAWVFYAPYDYGNTDIPQFVNTLRGEMDAKVNRLENSVSDFLMATVLDAYEYVTLRKIAGSDDNRSYFFNRLEGQDLLERLRNRGLIEEKLGGSVFADRSDRYITVTDWFVITPKGQRYLKAIDERKLGDELYRIVNKK